MKSKRNRQVEELAAATRNTMGLGSIPAASLLATLEDTYGVKIFYEDLSGNADGDSSAACARGDFGAAVLMDASEAPWRRNFNLAHELFHLVTWTSTTRAWQRHAVEDGPPAWDARIEGLANVFAAHLLLPAESLTTHFNVKIQDGKISYSALIQLARDFGVSTHALLIGLQRLGRINSSQQEEILANPEFRRADRSSMVGYWGSDRPAVPFTNRYRELALRAYREGTIGISKLAEILEQPAGDLLEIDQDWIAARETSVPVA